MFLLTRQFALLVFVAVLIHVGASRTSAAEIEVRVRSLKGQTIAEENRMKGPAQQAVVQVTVFNGDPNLRNDVVTVADVKDGDRVKIKLPAGVDAVRLEVNDLRGQLLTAKVDAILNIEQILTVVMPEREMEAVPPACAIWVPYPECCRRGLLGRRR